LDDAEDLLEILSYFLICSDYEILAFLKAMPFRNIAVFQQHLILMDVMAW